jgi:hypothetical protein
MDEARGTHDRGIAVLDGPTNAGRGRPGEATLRWSSRASSIPEIERELARIWSEPTLTTDVDGQAERRIAARTSVMNLVVIARRPELGERAGATIAALTGRHPSRTIVVLPTDPDGPPWLQARVQAYCMLPRADAAETCTEFIDVAAGGETGRHLSAIVAPLLIHDLPVTIWWPGEPPFGSPMVREVLPLADRLVVDGSSWSGDGLASLATLATLSASRRPSVFDFALVRQSRWREAIASVFDRPEFRPYLYSIRRIAVTYAAPASVVEGAPTDQSGSSGHLTPDERVFAVNLVKPIYHVAWIASRLRMSIPEPLAPPIPRSTRSGASRGVAATLRGGGHDVSVVVRPVASSMPPGTTLRVELRAERRGSELRADVTAEAELVRVRVWQDGIEALDRAFRSPRRTEVDLLAEAIESSGVDPVTAEAIRAAGALVRPGLVRPGMDAPDRTRPGGGRAAADPGPGPRAGQEPGVSGS